jgi:phospho-N-acetylmuramoyl-pentapeptide-transferase
MLGFLIYNHHPAKVFMGDTGSLFLGGIAVGSAFLIDDPMIILIAGGIYVFEAVSVILQVFWFKTFHKRIFKCAPVHHHFEQCGWSEVKVVTVFSLATALLCALAWLGL